MLLPDQTFPPDYRLLFARRMEMLVEMSRSLRTMQRLLLYYKHNPVDFICDWVSTVDPRNSGKPNMLVTMPFWRAHRSIPTATLSPDDSTLPTNKEFYENLKGQAGMKLRMRFVSSRHKRQPF